LDDTDDFASAWTDARNDAAKNGDTVVWGGRGKGGRGIARQYQCLTTKTKDIVVEGVTLAYYGGNELLVRSKLCFVNGRKYALIGRNGTGKTTLMRRMARGRIPGFPLHLDCLLIGQEDPDTIGRLFPDQQPVDALIKWCKSGNGTHLCSQQEVLEKMLEMACEVEDTDEIERISEHLAEVQIAIEYMDDARQRERARAFLCNELGFTDDLLDTECRLLSGGWKMRLSIARALMMNPDVLLVDEPTNHLDIEGSVWLQNFLSTFKNTVIIVSHDRVFIDAFVTDVVELRHKQLRYYPGDLSSYLDVLEEEKIRKLKVVDARTKKQQKAEAYIEKQTKINTGKKKVNDKALKQAKQKKKKMERLQFNKRDGKRYQTRSLKTLSMDSFKGPVKVNIEAEERSRKFDFLDPPSLRSSGDVLVKIENMRFSFDKSNKVPVLNDVNLTLTMKSKVAIVGKNGTGKTTLLKILANLTEHDSTSIWRNPNLRIGYVHQHHSEHLMEHVPRICYGKTTRDVSATDFLCAKFKCSALDARSHLARFGIVGALAICSLDSLSGGQKARLSFAYVSWEQPNLILMDEATNHLDMHSLTALSEALHSFKGAIVLVSHNRMFCEAFCQELIVVENGTVSKLESKEEDSNAFAKLFQKYTDGLAVRGSRRGVVRDHHAIQKRQVAIQSKSRKQGKQAEGGQSGLF